MSDNQRVIPSQSFSFLQTDRLIVAELLEINPVADSDNLILWNIRIHPFSRQIGTGRKPGSQSLQAPSVQIMQRFLDRPEAAVHSGRVRMKDDIRNARPGRRFSERIQPVSRIAVYMHIVIRMLT